MKENADFFNLYNHGFIRVAVGTPELRVADPAFNGARTIELMEQAEREKARFILLLAVIAGPALVQERGLPPGVKDTQDPRDKPPSPAEAVQRFKPPDGFRVTLFAGEPDVHQPIAMCLDDRGRVWVAEAYSYPVRRPDKQE